MPQPQVANDDIAPVLYLLNLHTGLPIDLIEVFLGNDRYFAVIRARPMTIFLELPVAAQAASGDGLDALHPLHGVASTMCNIQGFNHGRSRFRSLWPD